jgi:hypothetical protein
MTKETFIRYINNASELMSDNGYFISYQYGLRRHYHGVTFGDDKLIGVMRKRGKSFLQGISDGMAGIPARVYCMKERCVCKDCQFGNNVLDCQNNKIH